MHTTVQNEGPIHCPPRSASMTWWRVAGFGGFAAWLDMTPADPDIFAIPDPDSLIQLPWNPEVATSRDLQSHGLDNEMRECDLKVIERHTTRPDWIEACSAVPASAADD